MVSSERVVLIEQKPSLNEACRDHLTMIKDGMVSGNRKDNGAEGLLKLHKWIHETREAHLTDSAVRAMVDESGLDILVDCMRKSPKDTIVATRVLEVLCGESSSNFSLPFLFDSKARSTLLKLGFVEVVLGALDLPDLQSVGSSLGCRALIPLGHESLETILEGNGVAILMHQVGKVDKPFAFGALALLARRSAVARQQIREWKQGRALEKLLHKFVEKPDEYSPADNPAACLLFHCVWSWDELSNAIDNLEGDDDTDRAKELLESTCHKRRHRKWAIVDILVLIANLFSNVYTAFSYWMESKFEFCGIAMFGLLTVTVLTTHAMLASNPPVWKQLLNILTLGSYSVATAIWEGANAGFTSDREVGLEMFMCIQSVLSFFVAVYSLLIAGYIDGYPMIGTTSLCIRWVGIVSGLILLPNTLYFIVKQRLSRREFGQTFTGSKKYCFDSMLFIYQSSEMSTLLAIPFFQLAARPDRELHDSNLTSMSIAGMLAKAPIVLLLGSHFLLLFFIFQVGMRCRGGSWASFHILLNVFCNITGGKSPELVLISRAGVFARIANICVVWPVILYMLHYKPDLLDHFTGTDDWHTVSLLVVALTGSIIHLFSILQQYLAGRWEFDIAQDLSRKRVSGVFQSIAHAPALALSRWRGVHELLEKLTDRVPAKPFLQFHKSLQGTRSHASDASYEDFINYLFVAATGLMLPNHKDDLGKHCFGYATLVADEFHHGSKPRDGLGLLGEPAIGWFDPLARLRVELNEDWSSAQGHQVRPVGSLVPVNSVGASGKNGDACVELEAFKKVLLKRHEPKLGGIAEARDAFEEFLERLFEAGKRMSGSDTKSLNRHAFLYMSLMAYEFYFSDARERERETRCGTSTPVADNLGITRVS